MARIYVTEPGATGGIGAMGMRILVGAMRRAGHEVLRVRFYRKPKAVQMGLFGSSTEQLADAGSLPRPDTWFVSLLGARQFWELPDLFRRMGLPLRRDDRKESDPLVVFGGSAMIQPEPVSQFADVIALGDGEATGPIVAELLDSGASKADTIEQLDGMRGFWSTANDDGTLSRLEGGDRDPLVRPDDGDTVRYAVELARGCRYRCAFCPIGWAGGTYREAPLDTVAPLLETLRGKSANFFAADYSSVSYVKDLERGIASHGCRNTGRDARLAKVLANLKTGSPAKAYSFGIEGMSERLRSAVGKPITSAAIVDTMAALQAANVGNVRWYVILALPGETDADADEFVGLLRNVRKVYRGRLDITTTHLHGLAHTPFQWIDGHYSDAASERLDRVVETAKDWNIAGRKPNGDRGCEIYFANWTKRQTHDSDGYLYRAGQDAAVAIEKVDSVAAKIKDDRWREFADVEESLRERATDEPLPWDRVDVGTERRIVLRVLGNYMRRINK